MPLVMPGKARVWGPPLAVALASSPVWASWPVGPVVAAGWLIATAVGAAAGAVAGGAVGGMIGALTKSGVSEDDANVYAEGVRRGGTLVTARVDDQRVSQTRDILQHSRSVDLAARRNAYRQSGWSRFDEAAPAYTDEQVRRERQLYL
jgi:hypothetical protein